MSKRVRPYIPFTFFLIPNPFREFEFVEAGNRTLRTHKHVLYGWIETEAPDSLPLEGASAKPDKRNNRLKRFLRKGNVIVRTPSSSGGNDEVFYNISNVKEFIEAVNGTTISNENGPDTLDDYDTMTNADPMVDAMAAFRPKREHRKFIKWLEEQSSAEEWIPLANQDIDAWLEIVTDRDYPHDQQLAYLEMLWEFLSRSYRLSVRELSDDLYLAGGYEDFAATPSANREQERQRRAGDAVSTTRSVNEVRRKLEAVSGEKIDFVFLPVGLSDLEKNDPDITKAFSSVQVSYRTACKYWYTDPEGARDELEVAKEDIKKLEVLRYQKNLNRTHCDWGWNLIPFGDFERGAVLPGASDDAVIGGTEPDTPDIKEDAFEKEKSSNEQSDPIAGEADASNWTKAQEAAMRRYEIEAPFTKDELHSTWRHWKRASLDSMQDQVDQDYETLLPLAS